ncbi:hypothetical protein [Desmospora activa]|uniref:Uncharacterized protein n=1 Tax=Desmospora activa DSM 45169 TaxID=1121389 RepID=A0A2T4Z6E8_9BACL|nr:hypothetical protein [Desmospora activa]PTM57470.1 hypothetical protein C8J48_0018 [Desmospora activa DSM 45169]
MVIIRRSFTLVVTTLTLMWITVFLGWYEPFSWQYSIRVIGSLYFLLAILTSGLMSLPTIREKGKENKGQREEWSFIFLLVTVILFGISLAFP